MYLIKFRFLYALKYIVNYAKFFIMIQLIMCFCSTVVYFNGKSIVMDSNSSRTEYSSISNENDAF